MKELIEIQSKLNAPKNQRNNFGKYNYRSCEDILEAVKPLLKEQGCLLKIEDTITMVGERHYIKATATILKDDKEVEVSAFAREPLSKKGMDESQITGATSSYARKYALNGLFLIDDSKDSDVEVSKEDMDAIEENQRIISKITTAKTEDELYAVHKRLKDTGKITDEYLELLKTRRNEL